MYKGLKLHGNSTAAERTWWYIRIRWFFLLAVAVPGILSNFVGEGFSTQVQRDLTLGLLALASNGVFFLLARHKEADGFHRRLAVTILAVDILTITFLIFTKGGIESRSPILYTIPLLVASALFGQKGAYYAVAASVGLYNALILADFTNILHSIGAVNPALRMNGTYVLNTITFFTSVLVIISLLADFITRLVSDEQALAEKSKHDLEVAQRIAKLGSWAWDVQADHIEWSKQMLAMLGLKSTGSVNSLEGYMKMVHPRDKAALANLLQEAIKNGRDFSTDHRVVRDGKVIWVHADGQVVMHEGKVVKMFGTGQDVTELKLAEKKLIATNLELEQINNLMIGRELKMLELKEQIKTLEKKSS